MNCFFCQTELIDEDQNGIIDCPSCPNKTRYVCSGSMSKPEVWYIHLRMDPFLIEWDLERPATSIYSGPTYKENNFIMTLEQPLPYSQEEAAKFLNRLDNIKVFL